MGWADIGCYGSRFYETPHRRPSGVPGDAFHRRLCGLPGLLADAAEHHDRQVSGPRAADELPHGPALARQLATSSRSSGKPKCRPEEVTIAEALSPAGYVTAASASGIWSRERGRDRNQMASKTKSRLLKRDRPPQGFDFVVSRGPNQTDKSVAAFTDKAAEFIRANKVGPFFLYLATTVCTFRWRRHRNWSRSIDRRSARTIRQTNPTYAAWSNPSITVSAA